LSLSKGRKADETYCINTGREVKGKILSFGERGEGIMQLYAIPISGALPFGFLFDSLLSPS
jgi:hypothetical protein